MAKLKDEGFFSLTIEDPSGGEVTQELDLWATHNRIHCIHVEHAGKPVEFLAAVVDYLKELGFPGCSHRLADQFVLAIREAVGDLQKKSASTSQMPDSPASTA